MTLVTEKEAAEKWCPLVRWKFASTSDQPSSNRETSATTEGGQNPWHHKGTRCIASACMAWRKAESGTVEFDDYGNLPGYCGAFGKVEP